MPKKLYDPRHRFIGDLKGFQICISKELHRMSINAVYIDVSETGFSMVSTNGHIMALKHYDKSDWDGMALSALAEFGVVMPDEPTQGALILGKLRKTNCLPPFIPESQAEKYGGIFPYPKYKNIIPQQFENYRAKMPIFGFENLAKAQKVLNLFGYNRTYFYPTGWNSLAGVAVWKDQDFTLLLTPMWAKEDNGGF